MTCRYQLSIYMKIYDMFFLTISITSIRYLLLERLKTVLCLTLTLNLQNLKIKIKNDCSELQEGQIIAPTQREVIHRL